MRRLFYNQFIFFAVEDEFACRIHVGERVLPVTEAAMTRWVEEDDPFGEAIALRATRIQLGEAFRTELQRLRATVHRHTLRELRHCAFALDVYLWDACDATPEPPVVDVLPRVALYHTLAECPAPRPSPQQLRAFEKALRAVDQRRR